MTPHPDLFALAALACLALAGYAYVGYPLLVRWAVRPRPRAVAPRGADALPFLSVLVAARNEAAVIEARLRNLLAQDWPADRFEVLVASDASDDGTDARVLAIGDPRVRLLRVEPRGGKTAAINRLAPLAQGEILVHTDANVMFEPGALRGLAAAFGDPAAGVALGEVRFVNDDAPAIASGEGLYWRFESWVKRNEAARGLLCVANGGIYAIRRSLWRPLPPNIAGDAAEPLLAATDGFATVIAERAGARERAAATLGEEYARKVRIIAQQVACWRWIGLRRLPPRIAWAYGSHKLLRYVVPLLLAGAAVLGGVAAAGGSVAGAVLAAAALAPLPLAPFGLLGLPGPAGRLAKVALYFVMVNAAALAGLARGLSGRAQAAWEVPGSTRQAPAPAPATRRMG